ncbi:putative uridine kinase [Nocardia nova SH22a]|uniref:Putative uridine kinase n=2 Tax=Nocardia nova TaxID=37330 RepID=W5TWA2_9NOCA|nr:putative uridine kinase [Nocardia nova SH22a]
MAFVLIEEIAVKVAESVPRLGSTRLIAVDGPGGAGKSTLTERLAVACCAELLHTDDFASWDNQFDWWPRLERQVLEPLGENRPARYQRYDWGTGALSEWHEIANPEVLILEGVSSARAAVRERLSLSIWVETPRETRLARGLDRDGVQALPLWQRWMAAEEVHFAVDRTPEHADVMVDGQHPQE